MSWKLPIKEISKQQFWSSLSSKAGQQRIPVQAMIELTYGCNLRCVHCYNPTHVARNELTTEQVCRIIDQLAEQGCLYLGFTGGELFTRSDCFEIFDYARERGFVISLLTNATLITPVSADRIQGLLPDRVEVSIYGATAQTYERVTRIPGSYQRFVSGVRLLRQREVPLLIKMPVMTLNRHELLEAREMVKGWGIRFAYSTDIHPRADGSLEPLDYRLSPENVVVANQEMVGYRQWSAAGGEEKGEGCGSRKGLFTCTCGKSSLAVTPYGQMNLCLSFPTPEYDLGSGTVEQGWNQLVELVAEASAHPGPDYECPDCNLHDHCQQGPLDAYLESGEFSPCLPYFKELAGLEREASQAAGRPPAAGSIDPAGRAFSPDRSFPPSSEKNGGGEGD